MIEFFEKNRNEKWLVLRSPIALLMNSYYQNKNISLVHIDSYLSDLVRADENTFDIDDLCCHEFQSGFLYGTIRNYLENQFNEIIAHSKTYKEAFPQLVKMMERCLTWRDLIVTDLKKNELSTYEYYRKKIEQWTKDYPAKENTNNYRLVINTLHNCTKVAKQDLRLNTNLIKDIKLNKEQQKQT